MNVANEGVVTEGGGPASFSEGPAISSPADEGDSPSDVNWSDIATELEQGDDSAFAEGDTEIVETAPPPPPPASAPEAVAPAPAGETPPLAPSPVAPATEAVPQAPVSVAPETPKVDYAAWRGEQISKLEGMYKLSEDAAAQLLSEPEVVLPKMAAQLHMAVTEAVLQSVNNALPQVLQSIQQTDTVEKSAQKLFDEANPDLVDSKYRDGIFKVGTMYRQMNPNATPQEAARVIGNMVRTAYGLQATAISPPAATSPVPSAPTPAPYVPSRGGGGGVTPSAPSNIWSQLASDIDDD
jgi:hypothetical protein